MFPPLLALILLSSLVQAQEQERKLIDRLLRPNMNLRNGAQDKKFATASLAQNRQVKAKNFVWQERTKAKAFAGTRQLLPSRQLQGRPFNRSKPAAGWDTKFGKSDRAFETRTAANVRIAAESDKKATTRDFADNHSFRGQGKSQKALSQQDKPLTIEQVRELLNKNK